MIQGTIQGLNSTFGAGPRAALRVTAIAALLAGGWMVLGFETAAAQVSFAGAELRQGAGRVAEAAGGDFGPAAVGTAGQGATVRMEFRFRAAARVGGVRVLSGGEMNGEFASAGASCKAGSFAEGSRCWVDVSFRPAAVGERRGAVELVDANGAELATGFVRGSGVGALRVFEIEGKTQRMPASETRVAAGVLNPVAIAVDGRGNLYLADAAAARVVKETWTTAGYRESVVADAVHNGLVAPAGVAVDGAGRVYVADPGAGKLFQLSPAAGGYRQTVVEAKGIKEPLGVAVDGLGRVFVADGSAGALKLEQAAGGWTVSRIGSGWSAAKSIAVDADGTVVVDDAGAGRLVVETPTTTGYAQKTLELPLAASGGKARGLGVDGRGGLLIADRNGARVALAARQGAEWTSSELALGSELAGPASVAADAAGNVYVVDAASGRVMKENFAIAPVLSFARTELGKTSTDSARTVVVRNIGSAPLVFTVPAKGVNPAIGGADFTLKSNADGGCPVVKAGGKAASLAAGAECRLAVSFAPKTAGTKSTALTLTTRGASGTAVADGIALKGVAALHYPVIHWPTPAPIAYGTALSSKQLDATADVAGTFTYAPPAGTVLGVGTSTLMATFVPNDPIHNALAIAMVKQVVTGMPAWTIVSCWNSWFQYGQNYTCQVNMNSDGPRPTGVVDYQLDSGAVRTSALSNGWTQFTIQKPSVGKHTVTITYPAQGGFAADAPQTWYFQVAPAPVTVQLTPSSWYQASGQPLTLTAAVASWSAGPPNATGKVSFYDGNTLLGAVPVNGSGQAALTTSALAVGWHSLSAQYAGGTNYDTGSQYISLQIYKGAQSSNSQISLSAANSSFNYPGSTNLTVCVNARNNKSTPSGIVMMYDGANPLEQLGLGGDGCAYWYIEPVLAAGKHILTAHYQGDGSNPAGVSAPLTLTVNPAPVSMQASCWNAWFVYGADYTCQVNVSSQAGTVSGSIGYAVDGGAVVPMALSGGNARFTMAKPAAGPHAVKVSFAAQGNYAAAPTQTESFTVGVAETWTAVYSSSLVVSVGTAVEFTAAVTSTGGLPLSGTVTFTDNGAALAVVPVDSSGLARMTTSKLAAGTHSIQAAYSGAPNYQSSNASLTQTITQ